jgi:hypothetical protein
MTKDEVEKRWRNSGMMNRLGLVNEQELIDTNETGVALPSLCSDDIFQLKKIKFD